MRVYLVYAVKALNVARTMFPIARLKSNRIPYRYFIISNADKLLNLKLEWLKLESAGIYFAI